MPTRSVCDDNARALHGVGALSFLALATRRGAAGIPPERTRLNPAIGLAAYALTRYLGGYSGEYARSMLHPWFDRWVKGQLREGNHLISSYGYTPNSFRWVQAHDGKTFMMGGNSHFQTFWDIISEEHRRWNCSYPPIPRHWFEAGLRMLEYTDYVLSPSEWVTRSFLDHGFRPEQILRNFFPLDLGCFTPSKDPRPSERRLKVICTGSLSLRKGTPYLLEAFRLVLKQEPNARLLLTNVISESVKPVLRRYADLPIDWAPALPHPELAQRLRSADIYVLPSLEEGLVRTALEAMACGLPCILTPHTGANDLITPGVNGEIVPIRDPQAIAEGILKWWERIRSGDGTLIPLDRSLLSYEHFEREFIGQLQERGLVPATP